MSIIYKSFNISSYLLHLNFYIVHANERIICHQIDIHTILKIRAYGRYGFVQQAFAIFNKMLKAGLS